VRNGRESPARDLPPLHRISSEDLSRGGYIGNRMDVMCFENRHCGQDRTKNSGFIKQVTLWSSPARLSTSSSSSTVL
jgi:hypothetical protein